MRGVGHAAAPMFSVLFRSCLIASAEAPDPAQQGLSNELGFARVEIVLRTAKGQRCCRECHCRDTDRHDSIVCLSRRTFRRNVGGTAKLSREKYLIPTGHSIERAAFSATRPPGKMQRAECEKGSMPSGVRLVVRTPLAQIGPADGACMTSIDSKRPALMTRSNKGGSSVIGAEALQATQHDDANQRGRERWAIRHSAAPACRIDRSPARLDRNEVQNHEKQEQKGKQERTMSSDPEADDRHQLYIAATDGSLAVEPQQERKKNEAQQNIGRNLVEGTRADRV
jgi:hypothetical protein